MAKKGTGFKAPTVGTVHPKGSTIKRNANGRITVVPPSKSSNKGKKK